MFSISRYLIDSRWFKQWQNYVGYYDYYIVDKGKQTSNPGPIDNAGLFNGMYMCDNCIIESVLFSFFNEHDIYFCIVNANLFTLT